MVYIDKHPQDIITILGIINQQYHAKCLQTYYTIDVDYKKLLNIKTSARMYLN